mmetsp:Transcript_55527/g.173753  ORF Transcript_55527/g.173753 Transcript_55527/m.173753 type:complete len:232 (+) Transcript_55527:89-784(+)
MPLGIGINLFGKANTKEAQQEHAKDLVREWQRKLRAEARDVERSIKRIEQDEEKIKRDIKKMAKEGADPKNIKLLAKSIVRSGKAKTRLYTARATMQATASELGSTAATMRLTDAMKNSTEVMQQMNCLVKVPEMHESMQALSKEMMRAGLIEEVIEEGLEDIDGPELEDEAEVEVEKVLDDLAIDAALRMAVIRPEAAAAASAAAQPAAVASSAPQAGQAPMAVGAGAAS